MQGNNDDLRKPLDLRFFAWSGATFAGVGTGITGLAPMQPQLQAFVDLVASNGLNLFLCYGLWSTTHITVECIRRHLELQRESRRSNPKQPREAAKRAEVKRRRRQSRRQRSR